MCDFSIRFAGIQDIASMRSIEASAAQLFRDSPYPELAGFDPISEETYQGFFDSKCAIFFGEAIAFGDELTPQSAKPAGFALTRPLEGGLHLQEISVDAAFQRRGLGSKLLNHVLDYADAHAFPFVSLTTYRDINWNAPFYQAHGFEFSDHKILPQALKDVLQREIDHGANASTRVVMLRSKT